MQRFGCSCGQSSGQKEPTDYHGTSDFAPLKEARPRQWLAGNCVEDRGDMSPKAAATRAKLSRPIKRELAGIDAAETGMRGTDRAGQAAWARRRDTRSRKRWLSSLLPDQRNRIEAVGWPATDRRFRVSPTGEAWAWAMAA
jgi:hypothetical protein